MTLRQSTQFPRWVLVLVPALAALHLNVWLWPSDRLVYGWPVNLLYHIGLTVLMTVLMAIVLRRTWPASLDEQ